MSSPGPEIYWYVSFGCNLACAHCSVGSSPATDTSSDLNTAQALLVVEQLAALGASRVMLTGGEVLLRRDWREILTALGNAGLRVNLETNGMLMTDRFARLARDLQARRLLTIGVSLDGGCAADHDRIRGRGAFDRTVAGLRRLSEAGVAFTTQTILNRVNAGSIAQLFALAAPFGHSWHAIIFGFLNPVGRGESFIEDVGLNDDEIDASLHAIHDASRGFSGTTVIKVPPAVIPPNLLVALRARSSIQLHVTCSFPLLGILPDGRVTICAMTRNDPSLQLGHVLRDRLVDLWQAESMRQLRRRYVAADGLGGVCAECVFRRTCKGGCRAWACEAEGTFEAPLPLCRRRAEAGRFPRVYRVSRRPSALVTGATPGATTSPSRIAFSEHESWISAPIAASSNRTTN